MSYWIKRIALKSGEVVTEQELRPDENLFDGRPPSVGEVLSVACRGRTFDAKVIWCAEASGGVIHLRVSEVGLDPQTSLWLIRKSDGKPDFKVVVGSLI